MVTSHSSISLIFVSDIHSGNIWSIRYVPKFKVQRVLKDGFDNCVNRIKQPKRVAALLIGGDMADGPNIHKPGLDLWTIHPEVAVDDCVRVLRPLLSLTNNRNVVRGSNYHVEPGIGLINYDEMLAQKIDATPYENPLLAEDPIMLENVINRMVTKKGKAARSLRVKELQSQALALLHGDELESVNSSEVGYTPRSCIEFKHVYNGVALMLKHAVAFSPNYAYRGTGLTRNDVIMTLQKERYFGDMDYASIIHAYGHTHYYHYTGNATHHNFTIPCWKYPDSHLSSTGVSMPDFGIVEVIIEPNSEVTVHPYTLLGSDYPTPT